MNTTFFKPWNLFLIFVVSVGAHFLMAQAKMALDGGSSDNS